MAAKDDNSKNSDGKDGMGDLSQAAVKKMIAVARERGYITYDE
jgi:RNA polymerase primary sigma factor